MLTIRVHTVDGGLDEDDFPMIGDLVDWDRAM